MSVGMNLLTRTEIRQHKDEIKRLEKYKQGKSKAERALINMQIGNLKRELESHMTTRRKDCYTAA